MKVYILFNDFLEGIEQVFKNQEDAQNMLDSLKNCKHYEYFNIQEHEVIE